MAIRSYVVIIETPERDDDYDYSVNIVRHGESVDTIKAPQVKVAARIGEIIMKDLECEL